jgi:hypothetical protein
MAYDEGLLERLRDVMGDIPGVSEKKMFGGMCILVNGNMCCGILDDVLMARVGPDQYEECLKLPLAREMDFIGKPMKGKVCVDPEGAAEDGDLKAWIGRCMAFMKTLPPK